MIGGTGNEPKRVVLRAIGPSLAAFGITSPLLDPVIELHEEDGAILTNDNWKDSQTAQSKLVNTSTRGFVDTGDNVLIGGVIVASAGATVVVRAIGLSLETVGVAGALQDPLLEIHNPDGLILVFNDDWRETQEADIEASGIAPTNNQESTIIVTLAVTIPPSCAGKMTAPG